MRRSVLGFLIPFVVAVVAGAALIWTLPAALAPDGAVAAWIPPALGAVFAASAFIAAKLRPRFRPRSS